MVLRVTDDVIQFVNETLTIKDKFWIYVYNCELIDLLEKYDNSHSLKYKSEFFFLKKIYLISTWLLDSILVYLKISSNDLF